MKSGKINITNSISYQNNAIVSKELLKKPNGKIIVFAFDEGQELSEHTAPFDALVTVLEGKVAICVGGNPNDLNQGESILMPANIPHALRASTRFKMMLTMIKA